MPHGRIIPPEIDWHSIETMRFIARQLAREFNAEHPLAKEGARLRVIADTLAEQLGDAPPAPLPIQPIALVR